MTKKGIYILAGIIILSLLAIIPLISSVDTQIKLTNLDLDDNYIFRIQDHYSNETLERVELQPDNAGEYDHSFQSNESLKRLSFALMQIENKKITETKYFYGDYFTGNAINLDFKEETNTTAKNTAAIVSANTTIANETVANETGAGSTNKSESVITSKAIADFKEIFSKSKYYLFGAIAFLILGFIAFMAIKRRKSSKGDYDEKFTYKKLNPTEAPGQVSSFLSKITNPSGSSSPSSGKIENTERKIKELQDEIVKIKKEQIIKDAERKLEQDKQELEKLRRSTGFYS